MVLSVAQANAGVPLLPGRARYNIVTDRSATWIFHKGVIDGTYTRTSGQADPTLIDPVLADGMVVWDALTHGGLFTMLAAVGRSMVVEGISGSGTFSTVDRAGQTLRTSFAASDLPLRLAPYETVKVVGGASAGVLVRLDEVTIL